jgi:hypothetical protein
MPRTSSRPIPGRMAVSTIRQSLRGIGYALRVRNLAIADRLELIRHQAVLIEELRQVELGRRRQRAEKQAKSQEKLDSEK